MRWIGVVVAYPWIWLCSVYATWLVARISLGRSPRPLLDDPKLLGTAVSAAHTGSILLLMLLLPLGSTSVVASLWLGGSGRVRWRTVLPGLAALLLSWTVAVVYARMDPGHVLAWFVD